MKKIFIIYLCSIIGINSFGQVSIGNTNTPHPDVILDLTNSDSDGLLLPKTNTPPNSPPGNIVFDNSNNMISYADTSGAINYLSRWKADDGTKDVTYSDTGKIIINYTGSYTDKVVLEVNNGDVNVADGKIKEYGHDLVPQGAIIMWSGNTAPDGWALCDGSSYPKEDGSGDVLVPNLKGRFIVGYDSSNPDYTIGNIGGSKIMLHTHGVDPPDSETTDDGDHTHDGTTLISNSSPTEVASRNVQDVSSINHTHDFTTSSDGNHTHDLDIPNFNSSAASNTDATVLTEAENRPPYYALAYIYKL